MSRRERTVKKLSAEELKTKLYSHFDKTGTLNRMRTELRGQLISELLKVSAPLKTSAADEVFAGFEKVLLPLQVTNWLVYDHLQRQGHQYALSVFVTEANLAQPEQLLTACDILSLFGFYSTTPQYKSIRKMYSTNDEQGCSYSLLLAVIKSLFDFSNRDDLHTNTDIVDSELGDAHLKELQHKLSPKHSLEKEQGMPFSSGNADSESSKFGNQHKGRGDLYCGKNNFAESNLSEQLQLAVEENKRENQSLRQKLLQELDRLHAQERSQQLALEHEKLQIKEERSILLAEKDKLKEKELLLEKEYENKLERNIRELETDFTSKIHSKEKSLEDLQKKLFEKEQRLAQIELDFSSQQTIFNISKKELEAMQKIHKTVQEKYSSLLNDNTNLLKKFESMSDYAVIKEELKAKSYEVSNLHQKIEDISKTLEKEKGALTEIARNLETKLNTKDYELLDSQRQLNVIRDTLHMKEAVWSKEKRKLEQENLASKDMYRIFSQKLEDQKEDMQALHQTIHLLHYQLTEKNSRSSSTLEPFMHRRVSFKIPEGTKNEPEVFRISRNFKDSPPKYKESSLKFIEDAKNKIFKLQQQENELQDKCSVIYSSVPEFNNQFSTNHLIFNTASTQPNIAFSDPIKTFTPNSNESFKNLIGNEMPTLDLSFPANIKNSFANTFADIYTHQSVKTPEIDTPALNASTSRFSDSSLKKIVTSTSMLEHDIHLKDTEYVGGECSYNTQNAKDLVPQLSNLKDSQVSHYTEYSNTKGQISKNLSIDSSIKTTQTQVNRLEKSNISSLEKESTATEKSVLPINNKISESGYQERKDNFSDPKHDNLSSRVQDVENRSSFDSVPVFDSERLKPDLLKQAPKDLPSDKSSKPVSEVTEGLVSNTTKDPILKDKSLSESVINVPLVVDLDAAWKRKSSLIPSHSQSQHESLVKHQTLEQATEHQTIQNTPLVDLSETKITPLKSTSKNLNEFSENKTDYQNVSDVGLSHESADQSVTQAESSEQVQMDSELKNPNLQEDVQKSVLEKQDFLTSEFVRSDSPALDAELMKDAVSGVKSVHEDSLSELSEIHLSCGSEQEQQKEDSDNW